ncbi:MAG: hypothetical protein JW809_18405 [Pirellulales bacterium]|nr:hypothetical protein [Pirellulales bacterium]
MSDGLDAYYHWLGIPPSEQPPNAYRLLGLRLFESSPEVIRTAAQRQMAHLRTYQLGEFSDVSQRLLNEVATAQSRLLDPARKVAYDRELAEQPDVRTIVGKTPDTATAAQLPPALGRAPRSRRRRRKQVIVVLATLGVLGAAMALFKLGSALFDAVLDDAASAPVPSERESKPPAPVAPGPPPKSPEPPKPPIIIETKTGRP